MNNFKKFKEQLPSKEKFYSSLIGKDISDKEYELVLNVLNKFEIKMMKDYHELNLKFDVLLLAYVFKKFGNNSVKNYGLCPSHYFSAPAVCCDAMLNMTKIELELISYSYMYIFFEKLWEAEFLNRYSHRVSNGPSKTNNKYLKLYDPKQESKYIIHLDENNLCG